LKDEWAGRIHWGDSPGTDPHLIWQNRPATVARVSQAVLPRRAQRGSGLGLAILRSIAERHAGKVWLESQLGFLLIPPEQPEGTKQEQNRL